MRSAILFSVLFFASAGIFAQDRITGLYNTGVDDYYNLLPDGAEDEHYKLIKSSDVYFSGPNSKVVLSEGFPFPNWIANTTRSKWIAPREDAGKWNEEGVYIYRLTFNLNGTDPNKAVIKGRWSTDNNGIDILINEKSTGHNTAFESFKYGFYNFEISGGFAEGINTLDFVVYNSFAPTGLRVEFFRNPVVTQILEAH